eukprot:COSAG06_NODE_57445_length_280_cov_0.845304_1_plen_30_part_10
MAARLRRVLDHVAAAASEAVGAPVAAADDH